MKVLLATNIRALDEGIKSLCNGSVEFPNEVYYREAVERAAENANVAVLSESLPGEKDISDVIYGLRCMGVRVIFLAGNWSNAARAALAAGVYDILFDPVRPEDVAELIERPRSFSDVAGMVRSRVAGDAAKGTDGVGINGAKPETRIVTRVRREYLYSIPSDYFKVAAFVGNRKAGTTTLVDLVADRFGKKGKKVVVLDLTANKRLFYLKCWGDGAQGKEKRGLEYLNKGMRHPVAVSENYRLYTQVEGSLDEFDFFNALEQVRYDSDVVLVDMDFDTDYSLLKYGVNALFVVCDLNIMDVPATKEYLKKLAGAGVNPSKMRLVVNRHMRCGVKAGDILAMFNGPIPGIENDGPESGLGMEKAFAVDFEPEFYRYLLESYMYMDYRRKVPEAIEKQADAICSDIYPVREEERGFSLGKLFSLKRGRKDN
ncbi:MAG: hypothetical protein HPY66_2959 [Firmicutes bacterium]|nr:hypothetical protein [Bacillota bacterium]